MSENNFSAHDVMLELGIEPEIDGRFIRFKMASEDKDFKAVCGDHVNVVVYSTHGQGWRSILVEGMFLKNYKKALLSLDEMHHVLLNSQFNLVHTDGCMLMTASFKAANKSDFKDCLYDCLKMLNCLFSILSIIVNRGAGGVEHGIEPTFTQTVLH